jgi:hypothetical protein
MKKCNDNGCVTCFWAKWEYTATFKIKKNVAGRCSYEIKMPTLPICVPQPINIHKQAIWPDYKNCPCYTDVNTVSC